MTTLFRRLADFIRGLTSLALVLGLLVGIPAVLLIIVGFPLPTEMPSIDLVRRHIEDGDIPDLFLIKTLAVVVWFVWIQLALATLVELAGLLRGRMSARAPVLPGIQTFVGKLVASTVLLVSAFAPAKSAVVAPIAAPILALDTAIGTGLDDGPGRVTTAEMPRVGGRAATEPTGGRAEAGRAQPGGLYTTSGGDNWWDLAERLLGDGLRWSELRGLNVGRAMPTGEVVTAQTESIRPGWPLIVPADADPSQLDPEPEPGDRAGTSLVDALRPSMLVYEGPTGAPVGGGPAYQVVEGDNLWDIADRHLGDPFRWPEIFEASSDLTQPFGRQITDPNLIWPDSILVLPGDAVDVPVADPGLVVDVLGRVDPVPPTEPARPSPEPAEGRSAVDPDDLHRMAERAEELAAAEPDPDLVAAPSSGPVPVDPGGPRPGSAAPAGGHGGPGGPAGPDGGNSPSAPWGSPANLALGSGAVLVATGLLGLLRRARRLRLAETGERSIPEPPPIGLAEVETVLRQRADGVGAARLLRAVASLGRGVTGVDEPWPMPETVRLTAQRVEAVVHAGGALPAPWREAPVDGGVLAPGRRAVVADIEDLEAIDEPSGRADDGTGPSDSSVAPTLVTVGRGLLVNLEVVGVVAVEGDHDIVAGLTRSLVHELAIDRDLGPPGSRPDRSPVEVLVSDRLGEFDLHPSVRSGSVDRLLAEADGWLRPMELAVTASGAASPLGLRSVEGATGPATPRVVLVHADDLGDGSALAPVLDRARDRRFPVAVVVVGRSADPALRPSMTVTAADGLIRLDPLGLTGRAVEFELDLIVGVEALIDHARRAPIVPRPEPVWAVDEAVAPTGDGSPGPLAPPAAEADGDPAQVPTEETPEHEIVTEVPVEEDEITDRSDGDDTGLLIRVLGPVEIEGGPPGLADLSDRQRSILAFLALAGPSTVAQIVQSVAPGEEEAGIEADLSELGRRLGPLFPTSGDDRYRVRSTITDLGSARRWIAQAAGLSDERARNLLHLALSEVRGRPFADVGDRHWSWIEDHRLAIATQATSLLMDACFDLCDGAYQADDIHLALWACQVASQVDPLQETALTRQVQLLALLDRIDEAERSVGAWEAAYVEAVGRPAPRGPRAALTSSGPAPDPAEPDGAGRAGEEVASHVG